MYSAAGSVQKCVSVYSEKVAVKLPVHWSSNIPTGYKRNVITGDLHRAKRTADDFNFEVKRIMKKFLSASFPMNSIRNTIEYFNKDKNDNIIPEWLFDERKPTILWLPFSESNEKFTKILIKRLVIFTSNKCKFSIVWITRNIRSLLQVKDKVKHYSCVIYEGNCSCGENYVCESVRNIVLRWAEHEDPNKQSEPAEHLKYFPDYQFEWKVLTRAPEYTRKRKSLEEFLIRSINPSLNEQLDTELLVLFRNGVTWS